MEGYIAGIGNREQMQFNNPYGAFDPLYYTWIEGCAQGYQHRKKIQTENKRAEIAGLTGKPCRGKV